ncbi:hypothetical protein TIFTF001_035358 [Ficus carica]|uniref:Uncharacterized protein n=1 Tax=Ficus carica TaxID=3494 RepID=A0AA88J9M3_FICCA|nr:hypothetical protein TIFTF001_035358 [Ficus carica]
MLTETRTNGRDFLANFLAIPMIFLAGFESIARSSSGSRLHDEFMTPRRSSCPPPVHDSTATDAGSLDKTDAGARTDARVSDLGKLGASGLGVYERLWGFCL